MTIPHTPKPLALRGQPIREDRFGRVCLDDIFAVTGERDTRAPKQWRRKPTAARLIQAMQEKVTKSHLLANTVAIDVISAERGRTSGGTYAHPILAAAYAGYLDTDLEIEMREVWLRYRAGDATLADEIMDRADKAANEWMAKRSISRAARLGYTDALKEHGVNDSRGYADCTNATYRGIFGRTAGQLKLERGIGKNGSLRDGMDLKELATVSFAEVLSTDRIAEEKCRGTVECYTATAKVAGAVKQLLDNDLRDRQRRMIG